MAWMVHAAAALAAVETACHFDRLAYVEIEDVVAVLGGLELSHRAGDAQDVELVRWACVWRGT